MHEGGFLFRGKLENEFSLNYTSIQLPDHYEKRSLYWWDHIVNSTSLSQLMTALRTFAGLKYFCTDFANHEKRYRDESCYSS